MIKSLTDLSDISGALPLMSVIQTDLRFACADCEGIFCQEINEEKTLVLSLRGETATICRLSGNADIEELSLFLNFRQVKNVLSDFFFDGCSFEKRAVLKAETQYAPCENISTLSVASSIKDYKDVFQLLSHRGEFEAWYPPFCRKVNNLYACGVYLSADSIPVSCAVAPFIFGGVGIVAGVFTDEKYRNKGFASRCVRALLSDLKSKGVEKAYLWCEDKNIKLYESIGFSVCGQIYVKKEE